MTRRIIITGGNGFIGANMTRRLLCEGHEIHLLVRQGYTPWRIDALRSHICIHEVDIGHTEALA